MLYVRFVDYRGYSLGKIDLSIEVNDIVNGWNARQTEGNMDAIVAP